MSGGIFKVFFSSAAFNLWWKISAMYGGDFLVFFIFSDQN